MKITKQEAFERMWKGVAVKNDSILLRILDCNLQYFSAKEEIWKSYDINFNSPTLRDDWSTIDGPEDVFKENDLAIEQYATKYILDAPEAWINYSKNRDRLVAEATIKLIEQRYELKKKPDWKAYTDCEGEMPTLDTDRILPLKALKVRLPQGGEKE